jgi:hypothetical protein
MTFRTRLQDHPYLLVQAWRSTEALLRLLTKPLARLGLERASRWLNPIEKPIKHLLFDCQMCGQCVLHYTGMTCPMTCPKQLRNGPCGGVQMDGKCETDPEMDCVWVKGLERLEKTPYGSEKLRLNPPVDWRLEEQSSWVTLALGCDQVRIGTERQARYASEVME